MLGGVERDEIVAADVRRRDGALGSGTGLPLELGVVVEALDLPASRHVPEHVRYEAGQRVPVWAPREFTHLFAADGTALKAIAPQ